MADESVVLEAIIRADAQNMGAFAEAKAAAASVGNGVSVTATQTRGLTVATNEAKTAERDLASEASAAARGMSALGAEGASVTDRFLQLGGLMGAGGLLGVGIGALIVGLGALVMGFKSVVQNSDSLEASLNNLDLAYQTQGLALQTNGAWIDGFLQKNKLYISDQFAARDAIAQVVRAGYDQAATQRLVDDAVDVSVAKHESFAQAVNDLQMGIQGNTRTLSTFGLTAAEVKEATRGVTDESERAAIVLALVEAHTAGARGGLSQMTGATNDLGTSWQSLTDSFSAALAPLADLLKMLAAVFDLISQNEQKLMTLRNDLIDLAGPLGWLSTGTLPIGGTPGGTPIPGVGGGAPGGAAPQGIVVNVNGSSDPVTTGLVTAQTLHALMNA